jgi:hypothetical protein
MSCSSSKEFFGALAKSVEVVEIILLLKICVLDEVRNDYGGLIAFLS